MNLSLKKYQSEGLEVLRKFLLRAREVGAEGAYNERPEWEQKYQPIPNWPESAVFPYVCLRVPTGGGKTVMASHAVGVASKSFLQAERAVVLWLAPSGAIVEQTLEALRDRRHPYRMALDEAFGGCVTVLSVDEALSVKPGTMDADTTLIVATMQTFRVSNQEGRRVYKGNGELMDHFANLGEHQLALLERTDEEGNLVKEGGVYARSLANVLRLRMPLVIVDEAHNARSALSFEVLERFNPSAVLEFTATPAPHGKNKIGSNILYSVSAAELKAEHMIKLPIRLVERGDPHEAIQSAIDKRQELERLAAEEERTSGEYIRPIVLFQAESKREGEDRITAEVLRDWLVKDYEVQPEEVAIRTGEIDELPDNPLARDCKLKYVITVSALREGWDCPFAYVLCSVANLSARGAVEQLLGRVLRLPYAREKSTPELNQAYAYATSRDFGAAAQSLKDALVESGFERYEAEAAVAEDDGGRPGMGEGEMGPLFVESVAEVVSTPLPTASVAALPKEVREAISFQTRADTKETEIVWNGPAMTEQQASTLAELFKSPEDRRAVEKVKRKTWGQGTSPSEMGDTLAAPQLAFKDETAEKGWTLFAPTDAEIQWRLDECDAVLGPDALDPAKTTTTGAIITVGQEGKFTVDLLTRLSEQMQLRDLRGPKTPERFVDWLDAEIQVPEATQKEKRAFLDRVVAHLMAQRGLTFETLLPLRWRLVGAIENRIAEHRMRAERAAYQAVLFEDAGPKIESRAEVIFTFPGGIGVYPAATLYEGDILFRRHFYKNIGGMDSEEARCAAIIDKHPDVAYWVRNLTAGAFAFSLPLADRNFYPDFVAKLRDGRVAVIEYKGAVYRTNDDSREKDLIGKLWAERSGKQCVFAMVGKDDMASRLEVLLSPLG